MTEIFKTPARSSLDLAGVFEHDGKVGHFYLYRNTEKDPQILAARGIVEGHIDASDRDVVVLWDASENFVGLLIKGRLVAAFDAELGLGFGGDVQSREQNEIPPYISSKFR